MTLTERRPWDSITEFKLAQPGDAVMTTSSSTVMLGRPHELSDAQSPRLLKKDPDNTPFRVLGLPWWPRQ